MQSRRCQNLPWGLGVSSGLALLRHSRGLSRAGTILSVFALLMQVWLPWGHHPAITVAGDPQAFARAVAFFGDNLALCLEQGANSQDHSGAPAKTPQKPTPCPICQTLQLLGSLLVPSGAVVVDGPRLTDPVDATSHAPLLARTLDPTSQPRAPPSLMV